MASWVEVNFPEYANVGNFIVCVGTPGKDDIEFGVYKLAMDTVNAALLILQDGFYNAVEQHACKGKEQSESVEVAAMQVGIDPKHQKIYMELLREVFSKLQDDDWDGLILNDHYKATGEYRIFRDALTCERTTTYIERPQMINSYYRSLRDFIAGTFLHMLQNEARVNVCQNCGRYFFPTKRSDAKYCSFPSPQDKLKTCSEYGTQKLWYDKLKNDETAKKARCVASGKQRLVRRYPDIPAYKNMLDYFSKENKAWKVAVLSGEKTSEAYMKWLCEIQEKKTL